MVAPGLVCMVICRYCWARFEYGVNVDVPRASMTELLMAASMGRWFMYLSLGLSTSHARCARVGVVVLVCKEVCWVVLASNDIGGNSSFTTYVPNTNEESAVEVARGVDTRRIMSGLDQIFVWLQ